MRYSVLVLAALLLLPGLSWATISYGPISADTLDPPYTDWSSSLSLPKFNPSYGRLEKVVLLLNGAMQTVLTVQNTSPSPSTGTARTHLVMNVEEPGGLFAQEVDILSSSFSYSLAAGQSISSGTITKSASIFEEYTSAAILNAFTGSGDIILNASTYTETFLANTGGNTSAGQITTAGLTGHVTYYYSDIPVPEPLTLASVALGLIGLGRYVRRRTPIGS